MTPGQDNTSAPGSGIYLIRCIPTGKVYVGSAFRISKRWNDHRKALIEGRHHSPLLQRAWRKYGQEAFEFIVVVYCHRGDLLWLEQGFMNQYKSYDPAHGFNINRTAGSRLGMRLGAESKAKLRAANLGKTVSPEIRAKMSESARGKERSAEHCANLSTALRGIRRSPEHCKRMSEMKTELCSSKEFRVKMSRAGGGFTDEQLARIRKLIAEGVKYRLIGIEFACSIQLICDIKHGRKYRER
jgi:group I intron endonuclease